MDDAQPRRRPGAQPGNRNAALFERAKLTAHTRELLAVAPDGGDQPAALQADIDLLRVEMVRMVANGDYDARALAAVARAIATHTALVARLSATESSALDGAVDNVLADVLAATADARR